MAGNERVIDFIDTEDFPVPQVFLVEEGGPTLDETTPIIRPEVMLELGMIDEVQFLQLEGSVVHETVQENNFEPIEPGTMLTESGHAFELSSIGHEPAPDPRADADTITSVVPLEIEDGSC